MQIYVNARGDFTLLVGSARRANQFYRRSLSASLIYLIYSLPYLLYLHSGYPVLNRASVFFFTSFSSLPRKLIAYVNFIRIFLRSLYFSDFHIHFVELFTHETLSPLLM